MDSPEAGAASCPRLCVLTGFPRTGGFGGGVILRSILEGYPEERLLWISLYETRSADATAGSSEKKWAGVLFAPVRFLIRTRRTIILAFESRRHAAALARRVSAFAPDVCWMVLDFNTVLPFRSLMRLIAAPVHVSVHDDPVIATELCGYPLPLWLVRRAFVFCYTHAASRDCVSPRMSAEYKKKYGIPAITVTRGVRCLPSRHEPSLDKGIKVILGGLASNCTPPWPTNLVEALASLARSTGKPVEFHCFDPAVVQTDPLVKVHQLLPEKEFEEFIRSMHIGYACDPLTSLGRRFAASSLPTKIITYVGFGLPFVYHGPRDSTVGDLLVRYKAGVIVESESVSDIAAGFAEVVANFAPMREACLRAAAEEFDASVIKARMLDALGKIVSKEYR